MEKYAKIRRIWSWLPAFRMVGETQHMRGAADALHLSPSALSRSIALIESDLATSLFARTSRQLTLTEEGKVLLIALRAAMQILHDAVLEIEGGVLRGPLRISSPGTIMRILLIPALARLRAEYAQLQPKVCTVHDEALAERLLKGTLDVAFTTHRVSEGTLTHVLLGYYSSGIYCGLEHPLAGLGSPTLAEVCEYPFVAPPPDARGVPREGWPRDLERRVEIEVTDLQAGIELCTTALYLAVLPDPLVARSAASGSLRRIALDLVEPIPIFAVHRGSVRAHAMTEAVATIVASLGLRG